MNGMSFLDNLQNPHQCTKEEFLTGHEQAQNKSIDDDSGAWLNDLQRAVSDWEPSAQPSDGDDLTPS